MNLFSSLTYDQKLYLYSFISNPAVFSLVDTQTWKLGHTILKMVKEVLKDREPFNKMVDNLQELHLKMTNLERAKWIRNIADIIFYSKSLDQVLKIASSVFLIQPKTWRKVKYFVEARMRIEKIQAQYQAEKISTKSDHEHDYELCEFFNEWSTFPEQFYLQIEIAKLFKTRYLWEGAKNQAIYCAYKCVPYSELVEAAQIYIDDPDERNQCLLKLIGSYTSKKNYKAALYIAGKITDPTQRDWEEAKIEFLSSETH